MKKVLFVTNFSAEKKKARLLHEIEVLKHNGFQTEVLSYEGRSSVFGLVLSYAFLKFFNFHQVFELKKKSKDFDYVVIYGLQPLPGILFVDSSTKVIYQSLDDNVSYTIYELAARFKPFNWISGILNWTFRGLERWLAGKAEHILVNSLALNEYLQGSILNYYTSPFEGLTMKFQKDKPFALLYLGQLREEKGVIEIKEIAEKYSLDCHVYGIPVDDVSKLFVKEKYVSFYGNKTIDELRKELPVLYSEANLIGTSIIKDVHHSYATQEANKDIDYMAMGIPFAGNDRITTKAKIDAGCGVHFKHFQHLLEAENFKIASKKAVALYQQDYSNRKFEVTFLSCFN